VTSDEELPQPKPPEHPEYSEKDDWVERGEDPADLVGTDRQRPQDRDPDPGWQPDPHRPDEWRAIAKEIGKERRPRREDVYPYLLIRAVASGDRGARPIWPPVVCWESPDILLIDAAYSGPFDPSRLVVSPTAGRSYRVFVRIWNLGLFPAMGVHVEAWAINPGFFGVGNQDDPYYQQNTIGGRWAELSDRTRSDCTAVVDMDRTWDIDPGEVGHHCLLAEVSCPLDEASGLLLSNSDRHVGQRNLEILAGPANAQEMLNILGGLVPDGFTLELAHAGPTALGVLQALSGGLLPGVEGKPREIVVPQFEEIRQGVSTGTSVHLLTAFSQNGRTVVARSDLLAKAAGVRRGAADIFDRPGGARALLDSLGPEGWNRVGLVMDAPMADALGQGLANLLDVGELRAGDIARRFGGPDGAQHAVRFSLTQREGELVGGYTVVFS
jgi:hypothetical protein